MFNRLFTINIFNDFKCLVYSWLALHLLYSSYYISYSLYASNIFNLFSPIYPFIAYLPNFILNFIWLYFSEL